MSLTTEASTQRIGGALRAARRGVGLSRRDVAARTGLRTSELRNYERGSVAVPEEVVDRLAGEYDCDAATLLPTRASVVLEPGYLHVGGSSTTLRSDDPRPDEVLKGYLGLLYELRSKKPGTRIPLRDHDLDALAEALGGSSDAIETRLVELMHVTRDEAAVMTATVLRRRLLVPAAGLVLGAGLLSGAAKLADQHGSHASAARTSIGAPASVSRDDPTISTAAHAERVVDAVTVSATPAAVARATVTSAPDVVTPADRVVVSTAAVVSRPPVVVMPAGIAIVAPSNEVTAPTDDAVAPSSDDVVAPSADDAVVPVADDVVVPSSDDVVAPPSDDAVVPAVDDVVAPSDDDVVASPSDDAVVAPSDDLVVPAADDVSAPANDDATVPVDDATVPVDDPVVAPDDAADDAQDATAPECPPELLVQANQSVLSLLRDTDVASESDSALEPPSGDDQPVSDGSTQRRLSTGLRINTALDDAAGLSVVQDQSDDECDPGDQTLQDADSALEQANQDPQVVLQLLR